MKRSLATLIGSTLAALLAATAAHASPTEVLVSEDWEPSPGKVWATSTDSHGNPVVYNATNSPLDHFISFSNEPNHPIVVPFVSGYTPSSPVPTDQANTIVATNLNAASSATKAHPDTWSFNYLLSVTLSDTAGHSAANPLSFTGTITATAYNEVVGGKTFTFYNLKDTPTSPQTQSTTLDGNNIYVNLPKLAPNTLGSTNNGAYSGYIWGTPGDNGGGPQNSPEPSTLLLSFLGLSGLGAASWRKWRPRGRLMTEPGSPRGASAVPPLAR